MRRTAIVLFVVFFAVGIAVSAQAEMYQWTDSAGVKHYSNTAPPEGSGAYDTQKEIKYDAAKDRARTADDDRAVKKYMEKKDREEKVRAEEEKADEARQENIEKEKLESEKAQLEEEIGKKRRYFRGKSKRHIRNLESVDKRLAELKQGAGDKDEIARLEAEKERLIELLIKDRRYFHRGGSALLKEYDEIDKALKAYEK